MFRSFLRLSSPRARADSEQHEEWAKPHRSGKQQDSPDGKSRTCHASGKTRKETDQDRHCPDAHPYGLSTPPTLQVMATPPCSIVPMFECTPHKSLRDRALHRDYFIA